MRIKLGFVETDKIYIERLIAALIRFYFAGTEVYSYMDIGNTNSEIEEQRDDIVPSERRRAIYIFQKAVFFYKDVLVLYLEYTSRIIRRRQNGELAEVITFTSPICGCGTTSVAAAFAINCSLNNKSALYLNLETIPCTEIIFDGKGKYTFTDVVYAVKSKLSDLSMKLESFAVTDSVRVDYFLSPVNCMDLYELNEEDIEILIDELKALGLYDFIVIDISFSLNGNFKKVLECSDKTVFVTGENEKDCLKLQKLQGLMEEYMGDEDFVRRAYIIINNTLESNHLLNCADYNIIARFEKMPDNNNFRQTINQLANSQMFLKLY